jgi:hypothetical protein
MSVLVRSTHQPLHVQFMRVLVSSSSSRFTSSACVLVSSSHQPLHVQCMRVLVGGSHQQLHFQCGGKH